MMPKLSATPRDHLDRLRRAGTNEREFHKAFSLLRDDARLDDQAVAGIANAYCGQHDRRAERGIALGAIESHFYRQRNRGRSPTIEGRGDRRHG